jgi:hypothetical protein
MTTLDDKHYRAKITKRIDLAPELWMIRIDPGGIQILLWTYATSACMARRALGTPYSIVSSPYEARSVLLSWFLTRTFTPKIWA